MQDFLNLEKSRNPSCKYSNGGQFVDFSLKSRFRVDFLNLEFPRFSKIFQKFFQQKFLSPPRPGGGIRNPGSWSQKLKIQKSYLSKNLRFHFVKTAKLTNIGNCHNPDWQFKLHYLITSFRLGLLFRVYVMEPEALRGFRMSLFSILLWLLIYIRGTRW